MIIDSRRTLIKQIKQIRQQKRDKKIRYLRFISKICESTLCKKHFWLFRTNIYICTKLKDYDDVLDT